MFLIQIYIKSLWSRLVNTEVKIYVYWRPFLVHLLTGLSKKINFKFFITFSTTVHLATATHIRLACRVPVAVSIKCIYKLYQQLELVRCISCASSSTCNLSEHKPLVAHLNVNYSQHFNAAIDRHKKSLVTVIYWWRRLPDSRLHDISTIKVIGASVALHTLVMRYVVYSADFWHWTDSAWA